MKINGLYQHNERKVVLLPFDCCLALEGVSWLHKLRVNPERRHVSDSTSLNFLLFCALATLCVIFGTRNMPKQLYWWLKQWQTLSADSHVLCWKTGNGGGQPAPRETGGRRRAVGRQRPRKRRRDLRTSFKAVCLIQMTLFHSDFFPKCSLRISTYSKRHHPWHRINLYLKRAPRIRRPSK